MVEVREFLFIKSQFWKYFYFDKKDNDYLSGVLYLKFKGIRHYFANNFQKPIHIFMRHQFIELSFIHNPFIEIVFRTICVYLFMIIAIRIFGKKELAQLSVIDLVFILL